MLPVAHLEERDPPKVEAESSNLSGQASRHSCRPEKEPQNPRPQPQVRITAGTPYLAEMQSPPGDNLPDL
jgi:hypothetical protein